MKDYVSSLAAQGSLGPALSGLATGYSFVYHVEMYLLFVTLVVIGPLAKRTVTSSVTPAKRTGLADLRG